MSGQVAERMGPERMHVLGQIAYGTGPLERRLRLLIALAGIVLGLLALKAPLDSLAAPTVFRKDFMQEYLLARSVADGVNPYLPVRELAAQYLGPLPQLNAAWPHPTPHPPPVGLLFLPLAYLGFAQGATLWLGLELLSLIAVVSLLGRWGTRGLSRAATVGIGTALIAWFPFNTALFYGQLTVVLLLLLAGTRAAISSKHSTVAGLLLGLAVLIKPVPLPLILLLAVRKQWRTCAIATLAILLGYAATAAVVGPDVIISYVTALPSVSDTYRSSSWNISLWTIGWRVFDGTRSPVLPGLIGAPLMQSALGASLLSAALPALALLTSLVLVRKRPNLDAAFCGFICVSILISPTSWSHYLTFAAIPAARIIHLLARTRLPVRETSLMLGLALLLLVSDGIWALLAVVLSGQTLSNPVSSVIPFWLTLLTLMPAAGVMLLGWTVLRWRATEEIGEVRRTECRT